MKLSPSIVRPARESWTQINCEISHDGSIPRGDPSVAPARPAAEQHSGCSGTIHTIRVCASSAYTPTDRSSLFGSAEIIEHLAFSRPTRSSGFGSARTQTMNGCYPSCSMFDWLVFWGPSSNLLCAVARQHGSAYRQHPGGGSAGRSRDGAAYNSGRSLCQSVACS